MLLSVGENKALQERNVTSHARGCFQPASDKHFRSKVTTQEVLEYSWDCYSPDSQGQATWMLAIRPSSHPTDILSASPTWHYKHRVKVSPSWTWHNSSVSWLIVQNIFLIIYHIFLNEIVGWGKDFWAGDENGIWEVIRLQKLGLMPPKQFGEIYLIDMLCFSKL